MPAESTQKDRRHEQKKDKTRVSAYTLQLKSGAPFRWLDQLTSHSHCSKLSDRMGRKYHRNDNGGSLLATLLITGLAGGCCLFIAVSGAGDRADLAIGITAGICGLIIVVTILSRVGWMPSGTLPFWLQVKRNHRDDALACQYEPRKVPDSQSSSDSGSNQPITAGEVREIQQTSANVWVPVRGHQKQGRRR